MASPLGTCRLVLSAQPPSSPAEYAYRFPAVSPKYTTPGKARPAAGRALTPAELAMKHWSCTRGEVGGTSSLSSATQLAGQPGVLAGPESGTSVEMLLPPSAIARGGPVTEPPNAIDHDGERRPNGYEKTLPLESATRYSSWPPTLK